MVFVQLLSYLVAAGIVVLAPAIVAAFVVSDLPSTVVKKAEASITEKETALQPPSDANRPPVWIAPTREYAKPPSIVLPTYEGAKEQPKKELNKKKEAKKQTKKSKTQPAKKHPPRITPEAATSYAAAPEVAIPPIQRD